MRSNKKNSTKLIALEHIKALWNSLKSTKDLTLSKRYVHLIRRIGMKHRVSVPTEIKRSYCKYCHTAFIWGENVRIRLRNGKKVYYCKTCKNFMRIPYSKK